MYVVVHNVGIGVPTVVGVAVVADAVAAHALENIVVVVLAEGVWVCDSVAVGHHAGCSFFLELAYAPCHLRARHYLHVQPSYWPLTKLFVLYHAPSGVLHAIAIALPSVYVVLLYLLQVMLDPFLLRCMHV